jgi:excisionase family DNA binding protein
MKEVRKCKYCGKEFVPRSGMQKYCCEGCQTKAKEARKKRQQDFMNAVEPVIDLQCQEYLTFAKAAILMGCSRQYVYKLVNEGKLTASRISSRMAFIRKADIEKTAKRNQVPMCQIAGTNYWGKGNQRSPVRPL